MYELVHSTLHNPNTPPAATPLVSGPVIRLPGQHGKVRREGNRTTSIVAMPRSGGSPL
jgi:hypothetical protein